MVRCLAVVVDRAARQRREIDPAKGGLKASIERNGVINPIVIRRDMALVAGERRLAASLELGLPEIPARFIDTLDEIDLQIIEAEENLKREDLAWQDIVRLTGNIHALYRLRDSEWTMGETAEQLCVSIGHVSEQLKIFAQLSDEKVAGSGTMREAYNVIDRRDVRAAASAAEYLLDITNEILAPAPPGAPANVVPLPRVALPAELPARQLAPEEAILQADFCEWAPTFAGRKFNLLHCDFPYGIEVWNGPQSGRGGEEQTYDDDPEVYWKLLDTLCRETNRLATLSAHLIFWYSAKNGPKTIAALAAAGWRIWPFPLIWHKTDNTGIAERPQHGPRHIYETALFASRGDRPIVSLKADVYGAPTDKRLHPSTKPEPMLRFFMEMLVDENTRLLDPTAGSGAALRAAESLGAETTLGLEIDPKNVEVARGALRSARALRRAAERQRG